MKEIFIKKPKNIVSKVNILPTVSKVLEKEKTLIELTSQPQTEFEISEEGKNDTLSDYKEKDD